jgi:hypothetical protein
MQLLGGVLGYAVIRALYPNASRPPVDVADGVADFPATAPTEEYA